MHEADLPLGNLGWKGYLETTQPLVKAGLIKSGGSGRFFEHFHRILKYYHLCGQPVLISDHPGGNKYTHFQHLTGISHIDLFYVAVHLQEEHG